MSSLIGCLSMLMKLYASRKTREKRWKWWRQADSSLAVQLYFRRICPRITFCILSFTLFVVYVCSYTKVEYYLLKNREFFSFLNWICGSTPLFDLLKRVGRKAVNLLLTPGMSFRWVEAWSSHAAYGNWRMWFRTWELEIFRWYWLGFRTSSPVFCAFLPFRTLCSFVDTVGVNILGLGSLLDYFFSRGSMLKQHTWISAEILVRSLATVKWK